MKAKLDQETAAQNELKQKINELNQQIHNLASQVSKHAYIRHLL
jgi:cell division protein FtsB